MSRDFLAEMLSGNRQQVAPLRGATAQQEQVANALIQQQQQQQMPQQQQAPQQQNDNLISLSALDSKEMLANSLLEQSRDRSAHPLARGIAAFFGAKGVQDASAERSKTEKAMIQQEQARKEQEKQDELALQERMFGFKKDELKLKREKQDAELLKLDAEIAKLNKEGIGGLDKETTLKVEKNLRDSYLKQSGEFIKQRDAYGRIQASAEDPSAAGDLSLVFNYMKLLDPGSTVREGEFASARNAAGVDDRIQARYNSLLNGENLAPTQRADFLDRSNKLYSQAEGQQELNISEYSRLADNASVDSSNVVIELGSTFKSKDTKEVGSQEEFDALKSGDEYLENGQLFRKP